MTLTAELDWVRRAAGLAAELADKGVVTDPGWRAAFQGVPRHVFVPRFWALDEWNVPVRLVEGVDPAQRGEWLDTVYSDRFMVTQWTPHEDRRMVTSSASLPSLVARMLHLLDVEDRSRVLEIGTGTGYNTALLCHRLGDTQVISVDIDPVLLAEATARLAQLAQHPTLVDGNGADGVPPSAPFDRILCTCASSGVPAPWIEQLNDGGRIVAPFTTGGALAVLTKTGPDEVSGHLDREPAWFMPLRPNAATPIVPGYFVEQPEPGPAAEQHHDTLTIDPAAFSNLDFKIWLLLHLPRNARLVDLVEPVEDHYRRTGILVHTAEHRAQAQFPADSTKGVVHVTQDCRRLFDTIESAWQRNDRPNRQRIGITAYTDGTQRAWLDTPDSAINWPLPT